MREETIKKRVETNGYHIRFEMYQIVVWKKNNKLRITKGLNDTQHVYEFQLTGPPLPSDIIVALISYGEEEANQQGKPFRFYTFGFTYRHPDYYRYGTYHVKDSLLEEDEKIEEATLFHLLYQAFVEEEQNDPLFEWTFTDCYHDVEFSIVKTTEEITFECWYEGPKFLMFVSPSTADSFREEYLTPNECLVRVKEIINETDRRNRLNTVFDTPMYYTKRFLCSVGFHPTSTQPVFQHLQHSHAPETIELYFKDLHDTHVPLLPNKVDDQCFLIQLLDTWILHDGHNGVTFFESSAFNEAAEVYQQLLLQRVFEQKTVDMINQYKTSS